MNSNLDTVTALTEIWSYERTQELSFKLWDLHLQWLADNGFKRALDVQDPPPALISASGHEVVDMLSLYVHSTGHVNAHLGLTSSDITDNVRLLQIQMSHRRIAAQVKEFIGQMAARFNHVDDTVAFTHWQPAAPISWNHRLNAWLAPLHRLLSMYGGEENTFAAKQFGGPVGNSASITLICGISPTPFNWSLFGLRSPSHKFPLQSSDHVEETWAVNWVCGIAAQLHKIAQDLRFLASRGTLRIGRSEGHAGSSSMPHKLNPYKWEKVCGMCRSIRTINQEIWDVAALNSMERTLDTSWQIKQLLRRLYLTIGEALVIMTETEVSIDFQASHAELSKFRDIISSDEDLTRRVVQGGESRWSAYLGMLNQTNSEIK